MYHCVHDYFYPPKLATQPDVVSLDAYTPPLLKDYKGEPD